MTHGYFLRMLVARVLLGDLLTSSAQQRFHRRALHENTGLTALRFTARHGEPPAWQLWIYNDHAHLG